MISGHKQNGICSATKTTDKTSKPSSARKRLWQKTFGSEPLPDTVPDAAERFAGSLGLDLNLTPADIQSAIDQVDLD